MSIFSAIAHVKPPRFIHAFEDAVEADAKKIAASAKVDGAECVGYAELLGFRYPVKAYHFKVSHRFYGDLQDGRIAGYPLKT